MVDLGGVAVAIVLLVVIGLFVVAPPAQTGLKPLVTLASVQLPPVVSTLLGMTVTQSQTTWQTQTTQIGVPAPRTVGESIYVEGTVSAVYRETYCVKADLQLSNNYGSFSAGSVVRVQFTGIGSVSSWRSYTLGQGNQIGTTITWVEGSYWEAVDSDFIYLTGAPPEPTASTITCSMNKFELMPTETVQVSCTLTPSHAGALMWVNYEAPNGIVSLHQVYTSQSGAFSDSFTIPSQNSIGTWHVSAWWAGDSDHLAASSESISLAVRGPI